MIEFFNREEDGLLGSSEFVAHLARRRSWHIKEAHISATRLPARKRCRRDYPSAPGMFWCWRGLSLWGLGICKPEGGGSMYPAACSLQPAAAVASQQLVSGAILVENISSWHLG